MENIKLSRRNAFRAKIVRNIANPEMMLQFNYYGTVSKNNGSTYHSVGELESAEIVITPNLHEWEVVEFKFEALLDEFWDAACHAFSWNSFSPEEHGESTIVSYEKELREDIVNMPEHQKERYTSNYKTHFGIWLSAHGNCASSFVTGRAKFNNRRNDKANDRESRVLNEFITWRERALSAIAKSIEDSKPEEQKQNEAWAAHKRDILDSAAAIIAINQGEKGSLKSLFVSSIFSKTGTFANHGNVYIVEKSLELIRELNSKYKKPVITERHKFFKLFEVAQACAKREEDNATREDKEVAFEGGKVVWNYSEDRLQVLFDEKPDEAMRNRLKGEGALKWSPRNMAWQRKLTRNAECAIQRLLDLKDVS